MVSKAVICIPTASLIVLIFASEWKKDGVGNLIYRGSAYNLIYTEIYTKKKEKWKGVNPHTPSAY